MMLLAALTVTSLLHTFGHKEKQQNFIIITLGISFSLATVWFLRSQTGSNSTNLYLLLGVSTQAGRPVNILLLLLMAVVSYSSLFFIGEKRGYHYPPLFLALFLLIYSQCLWLYFVSYSEPGHLLATSAIWTVFFTDIMDSHMGDIMDADDPLRWELDPAWLSYGRVTVLNELQKIFTQISGRYHLVKKTGLISVYALNNTGT